MSSKQSLEGYLEIGAEPGGDAGGLVGTVVLTWNRSAVTAYSAREGGLRRTVFPHVFQSVEKGFSTRLAILNPTAEPAEITVQVYAEAGRRSERKLILDAGSGVSDILSGPGFFGSQLSELDGHMVVSSNRPVMASAFIESQEALASIDGYIQP